MPRRPNWITYAYMIITTLIIIMTYLTGYAWPDTEATVADKCQAANGRWPVLIDNDYYICWRQGEIYD